MARQATNYPAGQLEALGYLERRATAGSEGRLIHLTKRSHRMMGTIFASLRATEAEWADEVGHRKLATFMDVLRQLHPDGRYGPNLQRHAS